MRTNRRFALLTFSAALLSLGALLIGCQHNGSGDFEAKSRTDQANALKGSINQLTPTRRQQIEAHAQAMMAAHSRPPMQSGQTGVPAAGSH